MIGYRNKHTANDNTSGIITITRILEELSPEDRKKVCAVYFDNEEKGLFGSSFFAGNCLCKKMKPIMFPSDQANFEKGIGVCSLKKSPIGMYAARIHTPFDTKCREENIEFLSECMVEFVKAL